MIKIENITTYGWEEAIRGMRNPKNSWYKSDTNFDVLIGSVPADGIGDNDLLLMQNLFKAGTEHRKYDRMITVYMDITAPLYWWKEFDTYKVGTVANSCSTMHKLRAKKFTESDFSIENLYGKAKTMMTDYIIPQLNEDRENYQRYGIKDDWWQLIQLLPSSYNQKRTVMLNYEVAYRMIQQRQNHKLDEWVQFVEVLKKLPFMKEITEG